MKKLINVAGIEMDILDPDFIPNLAYVASLIKVDGKPEVSDMVMDTWAKAHVLIKHIKTHDDALATDRLIKMVKFVKPLFEEVVPQVGKFNSNQPNSYSQALVACNKLLEEFGVKDEAE